MSKHVLDEISKSVLLCCSKDFF